MCKDLKNGKKSRKKSKKLLDGIKQASFHKGRQGRPMPVAGVVVEAEAVEAVASEVFFSSVPAPL